MEKVNKKSTNTKHTITLIIALGFIFGLRYVPPIDGLTELSMQVVGIFIGTIILWLSTATTWPSVLCIVALSMTSLYTYSTAITISMGSWIVSFLIFSAMITYTLTQTGYLKKVAIWFITRPISKKSPWYFLTLLFGATLFIGAFMSPIPTFIVFIPIAEQIFMELGYKKGDRVPQMIILGILCFSSVSTITTPIAHTVPLMSMSLYNQDTGLDINFLTYSIFGIITGLCILIGALLIFKYLFKPDLSRFINLNTERLKDDLTPMSSNEKITLYTFLFVVFLWMAPGILKLFAPEAANLFNSLGTPIPPMIGVVILSFIRINDKPVMNFAESISKGVPWGAIMLVAATMILGNALVSDETGIKQFIVSQISPFMNGLSPLVFVLIVAAWAIIQTNFAANTVTVTLVYSVAMPMVLGTAIADVNPAALASVIGAASCVAMATPPSTAQAALAAGTGWLDTKVMLKYGLILSVVSILIITFIGYPIASALM